MSKCPVSLDVCKFLCCVSVVDWLTTVTRVYVHDFICLTNNKTSDMQIFEWKKTGLTRHSLIRVKVYIENYNFMVKVGLYLNQCKRYIVIFMIWCIQKNNLLIIEHLICTLRKNERENYTEWLNDLLEQISTTYDKQINTQRFSKLTYPVIKV